MLHGFCGFMCDILSESAKQAFAVKFNGGKELMEGLSFCYGCFCIEQMCDRNILSGLTYPQESHEIRRACVREVQVMGKGKDIISNPPTSAGSGSARPSSFSSPPVGKTAASRRQMRAENRMEWSFTDDEYTGFLAFIDFYYNFCKTKLEGTVRTFVGGTSSSSSSYQYERVTVSPTDSEVRQIFDEEKFKSAVEEALNACGVKKDTREKVIQNFNRVSAEKIITRIGTLTSTTNSFAGKKAASELLKQVKDRKYKDELKDRLTYLNANVVDYGKFVGIGLHDFDNFK